MEETTTEAPVDSGVNTIHGIPVDDQGMAVAEPEVTESAEAEQTTEQETESSEEAAEQPIEPSDEDEQLTKFAETKGLTLDSDNAKKAAKMAMNAEKLMHQKTQLASELERAAKITTDQVPADATPQQVDNVRMRNLELKFDIQQWKVDNQDKLRHEAEMVKVLSDPTKRSLVQEGYLTLDDIYKIAVAGDTSAAKSQGKQEALQTLAHKQTVAVPTGNAVNTVTSPQTITPQNVDSLVAKNDMEWFMKNRDAINQAMAG